MQSLIDLIWDNDVKSVRDLLDQDSDLSNSKIDGSPILYWACQSPQLEMLGALLEFGANPNEAAKDGDFPIHLVAFDGSEDCVKLLISKGANVNSRNEDGKTALMNAAQEGHLSIVQIILEAGGDPTAKDQVNRNVLHWVIAGAHSEESIVKTLLLAGADPTAANMNSDSAIDYARIMGKPAIQRILENQL